MGQIIPSMILKPQQDDGNESGRRPLTMNLGAPEPQNEMLASYRGVVFHEELHVLPTFFFLNKRSKENKTKRNKACSLGCLGYVLCFLLEQEVSRGFEKLVRGHLGRSRLGRRGYFRENTAARAAPGAGWV